MHNSRVETKIKSVDIENRNKKTYIYKKLSKENKILDRL